MSDASPERRTPRAGRVEPPVAVRCRPARGSPNVVQGLGFFVLAQVD